MNADAYIVARPRCVAAIVIVSAFFAVVGGLAMKRSAKFLSLVVLLLVWMALLSCKPEGNRVLDPQTGALVSPVQTPTPTATVFVSPIHTPLASATPNLVFLTPAPWDIITPPAPSPTSGPVIGPQTLYDPLNHFSINLLPGWYAYAPDAKAIAGVTTISNYDMNLIDSRPPNGLSIQISVGQLGVEQTFEQWLSNWRTLETSPENGAFGVTLTEPKPFMLGRYQGVSFIGKVLNGPDTLEIDVVTSDNRVAVIGVSPADSPLISKVLSMLSTIEISPKSLP
jgi:hypothetical protein